jgi:hypothetical protein
MYTEFQTESGSMQNFAEDLLKSLHELGVGLDSMLQSILGVRSVVVTNECDF